MQQLKRLISLVVELWVQKGCLLSGHDGLREYGPGEVFERCQRCGRRSDGWQRPAARPQLRFDGDPTRHVLQPWDLPAVPADFDQDLTPLVDDGLRFGRAVAFIEIPPAEDLRLRLTKTDGRVH